MLLRLSPTAAVALHRLIRRLRWLQPRPLGWLRLLSSILVTQHSPMILFPSRTARAPPQPYHRRPPSILQTQPLHRPFPRAGSLISTRTRVNITTFTLPRKQLSGSSPRGQILSGRMSKPPYPLLRLHTATPYFLPCLESRRWRPQCFPLTHLAMQRVS